MVLSNIDFIFLFVVMGAVVVAAAWGSYTDDVNTVLYAFKGECVYEIYEDMLFIQDELYGKLVDEVDGVYIMRIPHELKWLARIYVREGA